MVKNINSTHRVEGIPAQFCLKGARDASIKTIGKGSLPMANIPPFAVPGKE
jgi:cyclopropane-fatty-acyl-phospholipid synthase